MKYKFLVVYEYTVSWGALIHGRKFLYRTAPYVSEESLIMFEEREKAETGATSLMVMSFQYMHAIREDGEYVA